MLFNSNFFLYIFLPTLLIIYYGSLKIQKRSIAIQNEVLLFFSLLFYLMTGGWSIAVLFGVILFNYSIGRLIGSIDYSLNIKTQKNKRKFVFIIGVVGNILVLGVFKYTSFFISNAYTFFRLLNINISKPVLKFVLPIGISFFVFQALSYTIDVYRKEVLPQKNILKFALYISLFPQLIAGPIVRYKTVCSEIDSRRVRIDDVFDGLSRFTIGLGKKVLIADFLGTVVDRIWLLPSDELTTVLAWSAAFIYTLQIYFDFSGYSDMAIGLGRLFGFHFRENFMQPYTSENINEFWKRWHISLSSFLKDYLYIPLGGNRNGTGKTYRNLVIVFLICGLWHGAAWSFVIWGIYHGFFQMVERVLRNRFGFYMHGLWGRTITFFIVMVGWVLFRAYSVSNAIIIYKAMFGMNSLKEHLIFSDSFYLYNKVIVVAFVSFIATFFGLRSIRNILSNERIKGVLIICVLVVTMAYMSDASFSPFIYFQF